MDQPRSRIKSVYRRSYCNRESWKDIWKNNQKGQFVLKLLLSIQTLYFIVYQSLSFFNDIWYNNESENTQYLKYFHITVEFWLLVGCWYFLWHSVSQPYSHLFDR